LGPINKWPLIEDTDYGLWNRIFDFNYLCILSSLSSSSGKVMLLMKTVTYKKKKTSSKEGATIYLGKQFFDQIISKKKEATI
jgi:hypothetical protein